MADYEFSMPYPPSVGSMWRAFRGRFILSKKGRDYRALALEHIASIGLSNEQLPHRLSLSMIINPPTLRKYDIDNFCKALFDALTHSGFWIDDEQIYKLTIEKGEKVKGGRVDLKINILD